MIPEPDAAPQGDPLAQLLQTSLQDSTSLTELIRATQVDVWRLCAALVNREAADDLTQDTFLRVVQALPSFRGESSGRTWVLSIARRTAMDHLRRLTRQRALDAVLRRQRVAHARPLESTLETDDLLSKLPADHRTAFVLTQVLGLSYAEAAEVMDCPVGTIRSRVSRARSALVELHA